MAAGRAKIAELSSRFGKASHAIALAAVDRLQACMGVNDPPEVRVQCADIFDPSTLAQAVEGASVDLVITDLPYGRQTRLQGSPEGDVNVDAILANLAHLLPHQAVIVLVLAGRRLPMSGHRAQATIRVGGRVAGIYRALRD